MSKQIVALVDEQMNLLRSWNVLARLPTTGDRVWPIGNHRFGTIEGTFPDPNYGTYARVRCDCSTVFVTGARCCKVLDPSTPSCAESLADGLASTSHGAQPPLTDARQRGPVVIADVEGWTGGTMGRSGDGFIYHDERAPEVAPAAPESLQRRVFTLSCRHDQITERALLFEMVVSLDLPCDLEAVRRYIAGAVEAHRLEYGCDRMVQSEHIETVGFDVGVGDDTTGEAP